MGAFCNTLVSFLFICRINAEIINDRYYPRYHLAPPSGWMNDPNGFAVFKNEYHLFYQHDPYNSTAPALVHWGHAKSKDLIHWEHLPVAISPGETYDRSGIFSGSALIEDGKMYLYYTAQISKPDETPDHEESQALAISTDGITMQKHENNPVLVTPEHQPDIRDPKVWKHNGKYYMVLGNSFNNSTLGRILLFKSEDKLNWQQVSILGESTGALGYMWECPDFFQLGGHFVLLFSPQGVAPEGDKYNSLYQVGYIVGKFSYLTNTFTPLTTFQELDHGHDFYATQTTLDNLGRRIVVAWFDMWDTGYPEGADGFTGQVTLPRSLSLTRDLRLLQKPVVEVRGARGKLLRAGIGKAGSSTTLPDKAGEVSIIASVSKNLELIIEAPNTTVTILYDAQNGQISLDRGGNDNLRRTEWKPAIILSLTVFIDASSIEVFCGQGEVTFSSRFFPDGPISVRLGDTSEARQFRVIELVRVVPVN